jgi:protein O-GlcNAc transferase
MPGLIAITLPAYEALAIQLETNRAYPSQVKQELERNCFSGALFNTALFAKNIEDTYAQMYERYHAGLPPGHI